MSFNFIIPEYNVNGTGGVPKAVHFYKNGFVIGKPDGGTPPGPSWQDIVLQGVGALTLTNTLANGLNYVKLFGNTEQLAETYLDTVTLSGGCEQRNLPVGFTQYEYLRSTGTQYIDLGYKGKGNTKVKVKFRYHTTSSATGSGRVFGSRITSSSDAFAIGSASGIVYSTNNDVFWCYDGQPYFVDDTNFGLDEWKTVVFSATEHTIDGVTVGDDYEVTTFETPENLKLFGFDNNGSMGVGYVDIAYCQLWDDGILVRDVVPAYDGTTYSMYDKVSGAMLPNAGTGSFEVGNIVSSPTPDTPIDIICNNGTIKYNDLTQIYTDGTVETVKDSLNNSAVAEILLSVGDVKDVQSVLDGVITRNIGILILDGTESWQVATGTGYKQFYSTNTQGVIANSVSLMSTIAPYGCTASTRANYDYGCYSGGNGNLCFQMIGSSTINTVQNWTSFLTDQYAQGTPVIVVYPLATATTDSATPQLLAKSPVTQTAGSISNLPIAITESSHTTPTPQQPLPINCNNGVLGIDSQGNITVTGTTETVEVFGNNLIDINAVTAGYYYDPQGNYTSLSASRLTDYIPIEAGKDVKVYFKSLSSISNLNVRINIFNSNKVWQSQEVLQLLPLAEGTKIVTPTANGYIRVSGNYSGTAIVDWNTASITKSLGTATAEMLLKVGDYQDVQSVIDGAVTRNVGVRVLDGTENWQNISNYMNISKEDLGSNSTVMPLNSTNIICSHFETKTGVFVNGVGIGGLYVNFKYDSLFTTLAQWKQYLADQYNAGTPVIVVYPLATETTETVTPQPLTTQSGTNVIQITQSSIDNLPLEVSFKQVIGE